MAKNTPKHAIQDSISFQAVCTKGDYYGPYEASSKAAEIDAANHTSGPGNTNHVVKIVQVTTKVRLFAPPKRP